MIRDPRRGLYDIDRAAMQFPTLLPGLVRNAMKVRLGDCYPTREEAEEAVMEAWTVFERKVRAREVQTVDAPGGWLNNAARFATLKILDKRRRSGDLSLQGITEQLEAGEDSARLLVDEHSQDGFDVDRLEVERRRVLRMRKRAAEAGKSTLTRSGGASRLAKWSDEQIQAIRAKRAQGMTYVAIAQETGMSPLYVSEVCRHKQRNHETIEGWSRETVLATIREWIADNGRSPREREAHGNPLLPSAKAAKLHCGGWNDAVRLAGGEPFELRKPVEDDEIAEALCAWLRAERPLPSHRELRSRAHRELPAYATLQRRVGSTSIGRIFAWAREHCAACGVCPPPDFG